VNTVVFRDDGIYGYNTDWSGFLAAFRAGLGHVPARHVVMLGCGGAGAAMAYAMLTHGTERLIVHDSEAARAQELCERLAVHFPGQSIDTTNDLDAEISRADGVINATPIGMTQYPGTPINLSLMRPDLWALDLNYFPEETELLAAARASGARTMNGRHMSASQVAEQMNLFGGVSADKGRIIGFSDSLAARRKANAGQT
jgi:shikimate dehydrogenase